jgi:hypothetical protein
MEQRPEFYLKSSSELTYRMFKLCKLLLVCSFQNHYDENIWRSERCIRKLISRHCLEKTCTRWNDFLFLITDDRNFCSQTCMNGLLFRECKHIKNIFEDVYLSMYLYYSDDIHANSQYTLIKTDNGACDC